jgi:tetratricopeptide (TPR) repeat protein
MHPQIEKLEDFFSQGKQDRAALDLFFDQLWTAADLLPRDEMRNVVNRMVEWSRVEQGDKLARATLASGFVAFHEGNYEASLSILADARKLFEGVKDERGVYATMVIEGANYRTLGEMELALKRLLDACQNLNKSSRYKHFQCLCLHQLAEIYSETGQYDEALKFHQLCEKLTSVRETENKTILSRTLNGIGVVYRYQKKYALAFQYLERALKLTEEINNSSARARVLTDIGLYYSDMGDYTKAAEYQKQALDIRNAMCITNGIVTNMILLAEISAKSNRNDDAIGLLAKALAIAEEIKVQQKIFQIHLMLSDIYQYIGDLVRSLFHYKAFHTIRDEVQHEDNEKKIRNLHLVFQAEQTIKENAIIRAQKEEIENKNKLLQETIDELTITKVSRKAKALTLIVGMTLIVAQEPIFHIVLSHIDEHNYFLSVVAKVIIILSLKPIDIAIENYLLRRIVLKKRNRRRYAV